MAFYGDTDAQETQEWQDAFDSVLNMGTGACSFWILEKNCINKQSSETCPLFSVKYALFKYNFSEEEPAMPGDQDMETSYPCIDSLECAWRWYYVPIKRVMT